MLVALAPLVLVAVLVAWIYQDVTRRAAEGRPVVARLGGLELDTPVTWLTGCIVLGVVFVPLYAVARRY